MRRPAILALTASLALGLSAQAPRGTSGSGPADSVPAGPVASGLALVDRVEAPIAYVRLDGVEGDGVEGDGVEGGDAETDGAGAVCRLLRDPGLDAFLGAGRDPAARAFRFVRGVLSRKCEQLELALTSVVPGAGTPLLLLRVQLPAVEAERLHGVLQQGELATPYRQLGERQTFRLADRDGRPADGEGADREGAGRGPAAAGPGELLELALVGRDLLVGNDAFGMQELLAPVAPGTSAVPRRVLSADPAFVAMQRRLPVPAGSLVAYGDWQRVGSHVQQALSGLPGVLVDFSGLGGARRAMLALAPDAGAFAVTLLLGFERPLDAEPIAPATVDGWLAAAQRVGARQLANELPGGGFGGVVLAVDLADLASRTHRGDHILHDLRHSFDDYGLDFDRHVLGRLAGLGTVQLLLRDVQDGSVQSGSGQSGSVQGGSSAEVVAVYAMRARNKTAAGDLWNDLRRAAEAHGVGHLVVARDRRLPDVLELRPAYGAEARADAPVCVAVVEDTVLVAFDAATLQRVHDDYRRAARQRGRKDAVVAGAVQQIGAAPVSGLFDVDLRAVLERLAASFAAAGAAPIDLSGLPTRHVGYVALETGSDAAAAGGAGGHAHEGQSFVRVRVLSSR